MATWSNEVFAENLKRYIKMNGKTQREVAEVVGVSSPTMHDWLKGKKMPRMGKIELLANYFGCQKSDLLEDKKEKPTEDDGLTENQRKLMQFAKSVPDDKAEMMLRVMKSIVEAD